MLLSGSRVPDHIAADLVKGRRAAHTHRIFEFRTDLIYICCNSFLLSAIDCRHERTRDQDGICTECKRFEYIDTCTDTAVHELTAFTIDGSTSAVDGH